MTTPRTPLLFAVAVLVAGLACASHKASPSPQVAALTRAVAAPDRLTPPEPLSNQVKALLAARMATHANDMSGLVSAIMLLDYPRIITDAHTISSDVNLSRPITQDATELNSSIPEKFFIRQDELKAALGELQDAARSANPYWVADAYGHVAETCIRCHADFRPGH